jgi:hypothetical protein
MRGSSTSTRSTHLPGAVHSSRGWGHTQAHNTRQKDEETQGAGGRARESRCRRAHREPNRHRGRRYAGAHGMHSQANQQTSTPTGRGASDAKRPAKKQLLHPTISNGLHTSAAIVPHSCG